MPPCRRAAAGSPAAGRDRIELVLLATLPLDAESRTPHVLYNQYFAFVLTDSSLAAQPYGSDPDALQTWLIDQRRACQADGRLAPDQD